MTATNTFKPAKDGTGAAFDHTMIAESVSGKTGSKVYVGDPTDESLITPMPKTGGTVATTVADGANVAQGAIADTAWSGSGNSTVIAALKAIYNKVAGIIGVSQSGTWTVQPGNTANTTAWKVDGSAVTQPVSAASLPLPTGAATSAKQPALGTAGSSSADVITIQGRAAMTPVIVDGSAVTQPVSGTITANAGTNLNTSALALDASVTGLQVSQGSSTSGQKGDLIQGAVTTGAPSYTTAQTSPLSLSTAGNLRVDGSSVTQPVSAASLPLPAGAATGAKQPALGTAGTASADVLSVQGIDAMKPLVTASSVTNPTSTLTRPADTTAYAVDDLIASSTTAGSVVVPSFAIADAAGSSVPVRFLLRTNASSGWGNVVLEMNLWTTAPTYTNGDNGAYAASGAANWIGDTQFVLKQLNDGAVGAADVAMAIKLASGTSIFWDLKIRTVATPISGQTFTLVAQLVR